MNSIAGSIRVYELETGRLPSLENWWKKLQSSNLLVSYGGGAPRDQWGRLIIFRAPGRHGAFDLYSCGPDGIDQDGGQDDVSCWAGVNDGYHWKATWPMGRWSIAAGFILGTSALFLRRFVSWRLVVPISGAVCCGGVIVGCHLLKHPGVVNYRNGPLTFVMAAMVNVLLFLLIVLAINVWRQRRLHRTASVKGN